MKILFFTHYFPPEGNAPASRTYDHCVRWVRAGHDVTVVTCVPNVPNGVPYDGYRNRFRAQHEVVDGIRVIRVWTLLAANAGFVKRILNYLTYMISATWVGMRVTRPDVVIATSPQFFCGWAGVLVQFLRRLPFVLEIRDIWPESITAVGAMQRGSLYRMLEWLERRMYHSADRIVAVGNGYKQNVAAKSGTSENIRVIYNGVDGEAFCPMSPDAEFLKSVGMTKRFVCSYVGTVGMAHGLEVVLTAAEKIRSLGRSDIGFLIVGDGARREELSREAEMRGVNDLVKFTGRLPKEQMPQVLASSHTLLVHLRGSELFSTVIPSKIFEAMAMCRPIIMGVKGESAEIVARSGAGVPMVPDDADSLVNCVVSLADDAALYEQLSSKGREFVLREFSRDSFAADFQQLLETLVLHRGHGRAECAAQDACDKTLVSAQTEDA